MHLFTIFVFMQNETDGCQYPANLRKSLAQLIEIRAAKWHIEVIRTFFFFPISRNTTLNYRYRKIFIIIALIFDLFHLKQESDRPTVFDIPEAKGPAASAASASGRRSNAIKIVKVKLIMVAYLS